MYKVTRPNENVIYAKHALRGKRRTRELATRESWTQKNAALVFINEEHSSLRWKDGAGMRRWRNNGEETHQKTEKRYRSYLGIYRSANKWNDKQVRQLVNYIRIFYCFMKCCINSTVLNLHIVSSSQKCLFEVNTRLVVYSLTRPWLSAHNLQQTYIHKTLWRPAQSTIVSKITNICRKYIITIIIIINLFVSSKLTVNKKKNNNTAFSTFAPKWRPNQLDHHIRANTLKL